MHVYIHTYIHTYVYTKSVLAANLDVIRINFKVQDMYVCMGMYVKNISPILLSLPMECYHNTTTHFGALFKHTDHAAHHNLRIPHYTYVCT